MKKLLFNENISQYSLLRCLRGKGYDVESVHSLGRPGAEDTEVFSLAQRQGRILLTRNGKHFVRLIRKLYTAHHGLVWVKADFRVVDCERACEAIHGFFAAENVLDSRVFELKRNTAGDYVIQRVP